MIGQNHCQQSAHLQECYILPHLNNFDISLFHSTYLRQVSTMRYLIEYLFTLHREDCNNTPALSFTSFVVFPNPMILNF